MGTYRTHFILNNTTPYTISVQASDWNSADFDSNSGGNPSSVHGTLAPGEQRDWPLELMEAKDNDPFTLTVDFGSGLWLKFTHLQKEAYQNIDKTELILAAGDHQLGGLGIKVYRQCQKNLPKPDWGSVTVTLIHDAVNYDTKNWMSHLDPNVLLCDINLPGTHDSAAISSYSHTPWACQQDSITQQLEGGVRMLDVRIKVKGTQSPYQFVTCHGSFKVFSSNNEYQDLPSLLDECAAFLRANDTETIVMSLKVDDYNDINGNQTEMTAAVQDLVTLVNTYPTYVPYSIGPGVTMPTLGQAKSKLFLLNRIEPWWVDLGAPLNIDDNMTGGYLEHKPGERNFSIYCQDKYSWGVWHVPNTPNADKAALVEQAWGQKKASEVLINFASGVYTITRGSDELLGFYINSWFLQTLGSSNRAQRPNTFGWMLFDFALQRYSGYNAVDLIVASNFNYDKYPQPFHVE